MLVQPENLNGMVTNTTINFDTKRPINRSARFDDTISVKVEIDYRLTKSAIFTPMRETDSMEKFARMHLKEKCYSDKPLAVPLKGLHVDDKLYFMEEPVETMDREVKRLKQSRILIVKVQWNLRRGPEFTWEREDQFQKKYPHLFTKPVPSSSVAT
ncbi:hypothetical protein Tco_0898828 [Tanacetum coccineum]